MAGRRQPIEPRDLAARNRTIGPPQSVDLGAWVREVIAENAQEMSAEDLAVLESQAASLATIEPASAPRPPDPTAPTVVRDRSDLKQIAAHLKDLTEVAIDIETSTLNPGDGEIVGVGLSAGTTNYYLAISHRLAVGTLLSDQLPLDVIVKVLQLDRLPLIAHNAKFEFRWLRRHAGITCSFIWDVMLAARLLASDLPADLKCLASRELDVPDWSLPKEEIEAVQFLPVERVARYCAKDCRYTLELYRRQRECLL
jgi:DNA polymerase I-like protein with 3'-5' exonuclease and polymerase domains